MNDVMKMYLKAIGYNKNKKQDKEVVFKKSYEVPFVDEYEKFKIHDTNNGSTYFFKGSIKETFYSNNTKYFGIYEDEKKVHKILDEKSYGKRIANYDTSDYIVDRFETMIIKETHDKINFIDENDVYVGFDYIKDCCERFGWYITNEREGEPLFQANKLTGYVFDTSVNYHQYETSYNVGKVSFKMVKDGCEDIYLTLFNHNKGWYMHEFYMKNKGNALEYSSI